LLLAAFESQNNLFNLRFIGVNTDIVTCNLTRSLCATKHAVVHFITGSFAIYQYVNNRA